MSDFDFSGAIFDPIERTFDYGEGVVVTWRDLVAAPTRSHVHAMLFAARLDSRLRRKRKRDQGDALDTSLSSAEAFVREEPNG